MSHYLWQDTALLLTLQIQPRASRDEIIGPHGDALKVRITAPPVDGKANGHLIAFLAKQFGVSRRQLELLSGDSGRHKRLRITDPQILPPVAEIEVG